MSSPDPKPIRPVRVVVIALLAGLLANVLVTWGLAVWREQTAAGGLTRVGWIDDGSVRWRLRRTAGPGMTRLYWTVDTVEAGTSPGPWRVAADLAPEWSHVARRAPDPNDALLANLLVEVGFGWPWTAASYEYRRLGTSWTDLRTPALGAVDLGNRGDVPLTGRAGGGRLEVCALPYRVAWPGFAGNTFVFAAVIALLMWLPPWLAPRLFVRTYRRRAGLCAWCGYDRQALEGRKCPECGRDEW